MKLFTVILLGIFCSVSVFAEEECESAVDAADSMNVNQKECDYTNEGLNGALHKAFKKNSEGGAVLETSAGNSATATKTVAVVAATQTNNETLEQKYLVVQVNVDQWSGVALARTQLLPKAMEKCAKGFSILRESYRPLAMGKIALSIEFSCLE